MADGNKKYWNYSWTHVIRILEFAKLLCYIFINCLDVFYFEVTSKIQKFKKNFIMPTLICNYFHDFYLAPQLLYFQWTQCYSLRIVYVLHLWFFNLEKTYLGFVFKNFLFVCSLLRLRFENCLVRQNRDGTAQFLYHLWIPLSILLNGNQVLAKRAMLIV